VRNSREAARSHQSKLGRPIMPRLFTADAETYLAIIKFIFGTPFALSVEKTESATFVAHQPGIRQGHGSEGWASATFLVPRTHIVNERGLAFGH
jgi:hypothetical protein